MTIQPCSHAYCTACEACAAVCPAHCITMQEDDLGALYPHIDSSACLQCGQCMKACPQRKALTGQLAQRVYAAWSTNPDVRRQAASGGVASALYQYALENGVVSYGVADTSTHEPAYRRIQHMQDVEACRNSKYVFSRMETIYDDVRTNLRQSKKVLFIGLPCQIAGLKTYLNREYETLTTVDIVCHGTSPAAYLRQHIAAIEKRKKQQANTVLFRDPRYGAYTFTCTANYPSAPFYKAGVDAGDVYQIGYHKGLIYRTNCYHCSYAKQERLGDLTISDFSGLGREEPFAGENVAVSCVLVNTAKGAALLNQMEMEGRLHLNQRPIQEAYTYEHMFNSPTPPHPGRTSFESEYRASRNFHQAAKLALASELARNKSLKYRIRKQLLLLKRRCRNWIPKSVVRQLKGTKKWLQKL